MTSRKSRGAAICLDRALRLEAKLPQPVHAQGQVGNLIFRVGPQCSDRLLYFRSVAGSEETETLQTELEEIVDRTNYGLMMIVGAFIQRRGFSFRQEPV